MWCVDWWWLVLDVVGEWYAYLVEAMLSITPRSGRDVMRA